MLLCEEKGSVSDVLILILQGGFKMRPYLGELMPLIVDALMDGASVIKREVAVTTLGEVVQSTGYTLPVSCLLY